MKRLLLLALTAGLLSPIAAKADLGDADLKKSGSNATSTKVYNAWCGRFPFTFRKPKGVDCKVRFENRRLIVNQGKGITPDQLINVKLERRCKDTALWVTCGYPNEEDKRYTFTYKSSMWEQKTAMITFRDQDTDNQFRSDLETWMGKPLRRIGPSIRIDEN